MKLSFFGLILALLPTLAIAWDDSLNSDEEKPSFGSKFDARSGNRYTWNSDDEGNTTVRGFNAETGNSWKTTIENDGSMRGYDADSNLWKYDSESGRYVNYGTGRTCVGKGIARSCF